MFKRSYYCLVAGLPDLFFGENKTGIDSISFRNELKKVLDESDFQLVKLLYLPSDNKNLLTLLLQSGNDFLPSGNFSRSFLEEQIHHPNNLPVYMQNFIRWVKTNDIKMQSPNTENQLLMLFYNFAQNEKNNFIHDWFYFEVNLKNVLTAQNAGSSVIA